MINWSERFVNTKQLHDEIHWIHQGPNKRFNRQISYTRSGMRCPPHA